MKNNRLSKFAVKLLKQYAKETGTIVRGTTDLSPLEEWLIKRLFVIFSVIKGWMTL